MRNYEHLKSKFYERKRELRPRIYTDAGLEIQKFHPLARRELAHKEPEFCLFHEDFSRFRSESAAFYARGMKNRRDAHIRRVGKTNALYTEYLPVNVHYVHVCVFQSDESVSYAEWAERVGIRDLRREVTKSPKFTGFRLSRDSTKAALSERATGIFELFKKILSRNPYGHGSQVNFFPSSFCFASSTHASFSSSTSSTW